MAESPTTSRPSSAAPEWGALATTKFHVPRAGIVPRPRLMSSLGEGIGRGLTLVCTPAGFGKTTLLGDWARRSRWHVAWLSLDARDNDPALFWRSVAWALERVRPGVGEPAALLVGGPQQPPLEVVAIALVNELTQVSDAGDIVLVMDDYHLIEEPEVHASVSFLLDRLPPGLRIAVATRADPPLPLARLRARGQLAELRSADLRFTPAETAAFLTHATGLDLPEASVAALQDRTEGWAVGLQLAALSLRGRADPVGFVESFSGSHRYVLDYLTEEVLAREPEQVVRFLLETSVLDRLSGPLCDAVTGRTDGQLQLVALERANMFLVPLDEVRGWWRYHHLFADLLRDRLAQERPERLPELHRNAAAWHQNHGSVDDAVRHALAAGEVDWAARLVEQQAEAVLRRSEGATLRGWLSALPEATVRARARLCLAQAFRAVVGSDVESIEPLLVEADRVYAAGGDEPYEPSCGRAISVLANIPASIAFLRAELGRIRGDPDRAAAYDRQALDHLDEGDWLLRSLCEHNLAGADWLRGRLQPAEDALATVVADRSAAGEGYLAMRVRYDLGHVQRAQGRLGAALATFQQALDAASEVERQLPYMGMAHVGMAEMLYERGELTSAYEHATQGVALCRHLAFTQPLATGLAVLAQIHQAADDPATAQIAMREAERVVLSEQVVALHNPVAARRAQLQLAWGDVAEAGRWAEQRGLRFDDEMTYPREGDYLALARLLLATHESERALGLLERLYAQAAAQGRADSVIKVRALQALEFAAGGDETAASTALGEALSLGGPEGYVRVFVDEGASMARLLRRFADTYRDGESGLSATIPPQYVDWLDGSVRKVRVPSPAARDTTAVEALVEPLSDRELQVLELIAAGRSNQQIADELVVVLATAKKHVSHILVKLSAANRTQAVARARALGLLT